MEVELVHHALHDSLTGFPNRALLTDRLLQGLAGSRRRGAQIGVMFLDVDHFKVVNDSLGHSSGDELLQHAAEPHRRRDPARRHGGPLRWGRVRRSSVTTSSAARDSSRSPNGSSRRLSQPCMIGEPGDERHCQPRASPSLTTTPRRRACCGIPTRRCTGPKNGAEAASRSSTRPCVPRSSDGWPPTRRLRRAARTQRVHPVHYQPIVDLATGAMVSVEALLRWQHPDARSGQPGGVHSARRGHRPHRSRSAPGCWRRRAVSWPSGSTLIEPRRRPTLIVAVNLSVRQMLAPDIVAAGRGCARGAPACARQTSASS